MSGQHAFLPPSGAAAWVACAAWPTMNARYPQEDTPEAAEGTAAHWSFGEMFAGRPAHVGQVAPNGVALTAEMIEGAALYVRVIDADLASDGVDRRYLAVEQRVAIPFVHAHNWGTPDTRYFAQARRVLRIYDFKFGHDFVDAFQNWQCVDYSCGVVDDLAAQMGITSAQLDQAIEIEIVVIQPRNYDREGPIRRWRVPASDHRARYNILAGAAERAMQPNPAATTGEQCKHCPGRHTCPQAQQAAYSIVDRAGESVPVELSDAALGRELRMLEVGAERLKARITGLQQDAFARLTRGRSVPYYALEPTLGREGWAKPPEEVIAIAAAMGVNVGKPGVLTPKQAEAAGLPAAVVKAFTVQESKGLKLVVDTGQRAAKAFSR